MTGRYHSRTFAVLRDISERLDHAPWAPHPTTNRLPVVGIGDTGAQEFETVDVIYRVGDDATIEWARMSQAGRDERFEVDILIRTSVPGNSRTTALDRLEELAEVAQGVFYAPDSGVYLPPGNGEQWASTLGGVNRVTPQLWATDEGWAGDCGVTVRVAVRI